ncbi:MAG: PDGLE domain-containing protein [bacterium]
MKRLRWLLPLAVVALLLGAVVAHFASSRPDGLERVAEQQGFPKERAVAKAPMPDYQLPWLRTPLSKSLAGLAGVLLTFGAVMGVGRLLSRRRRSSTDEGPHGEPRT